MCLCELIAVIGLAAAAFWGGIKWRELSGPATGGE